MSTMMRTIAFLVILTATCQGESSIKLSQDPEIPAVELWYVDQGKARDPEVAVFSNGRVRVQVGTGELWGQLSEAELQKLVRELLVVDGLERLETKEIWDEIQQSSSRTGLSTVIQNAGDTVIRIQTADKAYRIDGHAVGLCATRFHDCPGIQKLYSAQKRLENVKAVIMVGGTEAAARLALQARLQIHDTQGETIQITSANLSMVHTLADGTRFCQFLVPHDSAPNGANQRIISVFESPGEVPRISILSDGPAYQ